MASYFKQRQERQVQKLVSKLIIHETGVPVKLT